jgi:phage gp45-like
MRPSSTNFRERDNGRFMMRLQSMVRRAVVSTTRDVLWRVLGFEDEDGNQEFDDAEVFDNVGVHARPASSGRPEVIRLNVGGNENNPVIIASRDRRTLAAVLQALKSSDVLGEDETLVYNSQACVHLVGGEVHAKTPGGTAVALATKADVQAIVDVLTGWTVVPNDGGGALQTAAISQLAGVPAGTTVLKGE